MDASRWLSVVACSLLAGCGGAVQPGLANAPVLGGATPETRVHDAIANGRDGCERTMFPAGGVLRGQIPPCTKEPARVLTWVPRPAHAEPILHLSVPFTACPPRYRLAGSEEGLATFSPSRTQLGPACGPENASTEEGLLRLDWNPPSGHPRPWSP